MHELRPQEWEIRKANTNIQISTTKGDLKLALEGINKFLENLTENGEFTATLKSDIDDYASKLIKKRNKEDIINIKMFFFSYSNRFKTINLIK